VGATSGHRLRGRLPQPSGPGVLGRRRTYLRREGEEAPVEHRPVDSTVRFVEPAEVRPDLILGRGRRGPWDAIEVQLEVDEDKGRRWFLLAAMLHDQRGCMGDLWVITASRRTATWARAACDAAGRAGTRMRVEPIVLLLGRKEVELLLDDGRPSLAFFAAWAMQRRHGPDAEQVAERAMEVSDRLPHAALRRRQELDIMGVLNGRLVKKLQETIMDDKRYAESRWVREMRHEMFGDHEAEFLARGEARGKAEGKAEGEAKGKREALLLVLDGRGLAISRAQRAAILACEDLARLDRWIAASIKAASVQELLAEAPKKNGARNGAAKHRAARAG
jgi:hypothetical protein